MESDNVLLVVAIVAVVVSVFGAMYSYYGVGTITGFAANSNATVNITVSANVVINFTTSNVDFGSGTIATGSNSAILDTSKSVPNDVINGTWSSCSGLHLSLDNIGSINVSVTLRSLYNASDFISGDVDGGPLFQLNVTNEKPGSCVAPGTYTLGSWFNVTSSDTIVCNNLSYLKTTPDKNRIRMDIRLKIPLNSKNNALGNTIIATGTQSAGAGG